jgi:hypothetical protein
MLWTTTILGTSRPCAKSTSLGYIYKNWFVDACVGGFPSSMETKKIILDENEDVIASLKALDMDESNYRV